MKKILLSVFMVALSCFTQLSIAQMSLTTMGTPTTIDFDNTLSGVNNGVFNGSGFTATPSAGQLDSDAWSATGMSDGSLSFGGTQSSGDFARGASSTGVSSGGFYAFEVAIGNFAFGIKPGGSDFTPGTLTLKTINTTGLDVDSVKIQYTIYVNNSQARGNSIKVSYSVDNLSYTSLPALDYTSPDVADALGFVAINKSTTVLASVLDNENFYIRWTGDDETGGGSRDEFAIDNITITPIAAVTAASPSASAIGTNATCNGAADGSIDLSVSGGTAPYTFLWSNAATTEDITGLVAGTYTVTVTDAASSTTTSSTTITEPAAITILISEINPVSCNGNNDGILSASASNGAGGYSYAWSNSINTSTNLNVGVGTYTVTVTDANSCTNAESYTLNGPAAIGITSTVTNVSANGAADGVIDVSVTNGIAPLTYSWSNSATTEDLSGLSGGTYTITVTDAGSCSNTASFTVVEPAVLTASIVFQANVACNGGLTGSLTAAAAGGTSPYTYLWSNGSSTDTTLNLGAATYTVTVTDANSITATVSATITEPTSIVGSGIVSNVSTNGGSDGSVDLTVTGGVAPYSFLWSNAAITEDITNLSAGSYSVTITDANTCTSTNSFTITQPTTLNLTTSKTDALCNGAATGTIDLTVSGGSTPYTFAWSNAATTEDLAGLIAGTYTVTVTDALSITATTSATITEPTAIVTTVVVDSTISCNSFSDGGLSASATGGIAPYNFVWSNAATTASITGVAAGTYTVTISDANNCTSVGSGTITQSAALVASIVVDSNVSCNGFTDGGLSASATGGTAPYNFAWSNAATTASITGVAAGTYTVTISDANNCSTVSSGTITQPAALVASVVVDSNVSCNGFTDGGLSASATGGTSPYNYSWSNAATTASITGVIAGTYSVTITDVNNCSTTSSGIITEPTALILSDISTNVTTNGGADGTIDLTVSGGINPYTFSWSNAAITEDITGLTAGIYTVTVTDNNSCTASTNINITQPAGALAELIITEIMYNGPESGTDTSEFIEFLNVGSTSVDLTGYSFSQGVTHTFTSGLVAPGDYFVIAYDSTAFRNTFGIGAEFQWTSGGLSNGGEDIVLIDNFGRTVDSVDFDDNSPWPSGFGAGEPDGGGASIVLCDSTLDNNLGSSWSAAISPITGVVVNGSQIFANPGVKGICSSPMSIAMVLDSNVTCNAGLNGGASVNVTGGLAPFTFAWSNSATTASIAGVAAGTYYVTVTDALSASLNDSITITEPTAISVTDIITNASANGLTDGAIDITTSGGTSPYTYLWSNAAITEDITGVGAGSYTVTVTDANLCTSLNTYSITQPTTIAIMDTIMNVSCNGGADGSIALTVSGGISPYTFLWNNTAITSTITGLSAGTYNVTVTDVNSATATASYTVTEPTAIAISGTVSNATTNGGSDGSIVASVTGGTSPYNFLWSNSAITDTISNLSAATYYLTVTDANLCTKVDSFVVGQPAGALANLIITEINYNGPEAGTDTSEFIEFVNAGATAVDLTGYSFVEGVTFTFPSSSIAAGQYMVVAFDSSGFRNTFGFNADFVWSSGGLSNGGEDITIVDNFNRTVDSVDFDDAAPWPAGFAAGQPDGGGASIVLCDSTSDNNIGSNWFAASSPVNGVIVNGLQVFANPGVGAPCVQPLVATITVDSNVTCNNGANGGLSVNLSSGVAPISYLWSNSDTTVSITGLSAGTYTVTITDGNSATLVDSATITEPIAISFTSAVVDQTAAGNDGSIDITVVGGTAPYMFLWSTADTTEDISGLNAGVYTVSITDTNNCVYVDSVTVGLSIGIEKVSLENDLVIYPNPSNGMVTIESLARYNEVNVYDITGKVIFTTNVYETRNIIDLTNNKKGIYFVSIQGETGRIMKKVIIH